MRAMIYPMLASSFLVLAFFLPPRLVFADASDPLGKERLCDCIVYFLANPLNDTVRKKYNAYTYCLSTSQNPTSCYASKLSQKAPVVTDAMLAGAEDSSTSHTCDQRVKPKTNACVLP